ncbi:MAG: hypothetical protein V8T90_08105 [Victivallales bacterium]
MKKTFILGTAVSAMLLAGCGTTTTIMDPSTEKTGFRQAGSISDEELREVAVKTTKKVLVNRKFLAFLKKYKKERKDENAIPVLKLNTTRNDTDDPDLNVALLTDTINEELINSGLVDVTLAEGADKTAAIAKSRDLEDDENFDQKTIAKRGTLIAASLLMRPKIVSNEVRGGNGGAKADKAVSRFFVIDLIDINTGLTMGRFTEQLLFKQEHRGIGW